MWLLSGFSSSKSSSSSRSQSRSLVFVLALGSIRLHGALSRPQSQSTMPVERQPEYYNAEPGSSETQSGDSFNVREERAVKATKTPSVPTYVDMPAIRPEPITTHYTPIPLEPVEVRWDMTSPDAITPDRRLQYLDQDMRRLTGEMNRLWDQQTAHRLSPSLPPCVMPFQRKKENFRIDNPIIHSSDGHSQFKLEFDLRQFKPEEIEITTRDGVLTVQAKHEETDRGKQVRREYFLQFIIPEDVESRNIESKLSQTGSLSVYAPLARPSSEEKTREITVKAV